VKQLYIKENKDELDEQMDTLRDVTAISNGRIERKSDELLNSRLAIISAVAIGVSLLEILPSYFNTAVEKEIKICGGKLKNWPFILFAAFVSLGCYLLIRKVLPHNKKKTKSKK